MTKYSKGASKTVEDTMHEFKAGKLKSGRSGQKVTDRDQAIAIGISKARAKHQKTPPEAKDSD